MRKMMLLAAAAAALTFANAPAFAQDTPTDCPPGTTTTNPDGNPVTCDNDDNANDTTGSIAPAQADQNGEVLNNTETGQGVKDALTGVDGGDGGNNNGGGNN